MRQKRPGAAGVLLDPLMAACGERAIAGEMEIALCLRGVDELFAGRVGPVEGDEF
jgi:hypothetical protein